MHLQCETLRWGPPHLVLPRTTDFWKSMDPEQERVWIRICNGRLRQSPVWRSWTHGLAQQSVSVADLDLAVEPHRGDLLQPLEAEGMELEGGAAVFGVLEDCHGVVRWAAVGRWTVIHSRSCLIPAARTPTDSVTDQRAENWIIRWWTMKPGQHSMNKFSASSK